MDIDSFALGSFGEGADLKDFVNIILRPWISITSRPQHLLIKNMPKARRWKGTWPPPLPEYDELEGNTEENVRWILILRCGYMQYCGLGISGFTNINDLLLLLLVD
jgi:hypothetical protein